MKAAYDSGVNFFDCAEAYAGGESEIVMGEAIKKYGWNRNDIVISTKVLRIINKLRGSQVREKLLLIIS
jgi:aryl-alcohol dehydrogenase-like predicted oxidoreductase